MAENQDGQEKVHDPSEKRLRDAAEEGQIAQSKEIGSAMILTAGAASLVFINGPLSGALRISTTSGDLRPVPEPISFIFYSRRFYRDTFSPAVAESSPPADGHVPCAVSSGQLPPS